jgi:hypothetical protein
MGIKEGAKGEKAKREKGGKTTKPFPFSVPDHTPGLFLTRSQVARGNEAKKLEKRVKGGNTVASILYLFPFRLLPFSPFHPRFLTCLKSTA